jgi:hypothetical protein
LPKFLEDKLKAEYGRDSKAMIDHIDEHLDDGE